MKSGWDIKLLGEVCSFQGGTQPPKSQFVDTPRDGYVRLLQIRDFKSDARAVYVADNGKVKKCEATDIMIGRYGASVGQIHRGKAGAYNVALVKTIPDDSRLDRDYFYYFLTSDLFQKPLLEKSSRGAQDGFNQGDISPFPVPLPPLEEQQRIVAVLDEAFEGLARARAHAEANLQNARELFESYLGAVFRASDWQRVTLNQIADNLDRVRVPITKGDRIAGDIPYYGASGIVDHVADCLFDEELLLVSEDGANLLARTYPIAFSISGKSWVNNHAHVLRFPDMVTQEFVRLYLNSISLEPFVSGMAQPKLNQAQLNRIPIPFPDFDERSDIVSKAEILAAETEDLQKRYQAATNDLDDLRQSLLQKAFAGELT